MGISIWKSTLEYWSEGGPYSKYNKIGQLTKVHASWVCHVVKQVVNGALACGCVLCKETQNGQPVHKQSGTVSQVRDLGSREV